MRRMITESDVEKLDSIKPSEMQKLAAMQDPKEAKANQVLTADGTGKAVYKDASGKAYALFISDQQTEENYCNFYTGDNPFPGITDSMLYFDIYVYDNNNILLDLQVLSIASTDQSQTMMMNELMSIGMIITHPTSASTRVFIDPVIATRLGISDGSSTNVRYTYRTIRLQEV